MSKLTDKACIHTINPFGFNQMKEKHRLSKPKKHLKRMKKNIWSFLAEVLRLAAALLAGYGGAQL